MAASASDGKYTQVSSQEPAQPVQPPPAYYTMPSGQGSVAYTGGQGSNLACFQQPQPHPQPQIQPNPDQFRSQVMILSPQQQGPSVVQVTQPVVVTSGVDTTCAFVTSIFSTILCGFCFGAIAMLLTWKAKLLVYDQKYQHARHTVRVAWAFVGVAVCSGILIWTYGFFLFAFVYKN